ncbi:MAG: sulfite exporter TauE/SafE family protein [Thermoplasmatales archaeon]
MNAYVNSVMHFLKRNVRSKRGIVFTLPGIPGSFLGARIGHLVNGESLLFLFGILMTVVAYLMIRGRKLEVKKTDTEFKIKYQYLIPIGLAVGFLSGFFGIGGSFLIVPYLMLAVALEITVAVGIGLIAVGTFGIVSASTYALYHEIDLTISILYLLGGIAGGMLELK